MHHSESGNVATGSESKPSHTENFTIFDDPQSSSWGAKKLYQTYSATSLLRTLHWLPVKARIQYKIACLCFQCLSHNTMPPYLSDLLHPYQPPRTLRSLDTSLLSVPRFCLETFGRRSFSVFGPTVWNSLPLSLRKTQCFSTFKKKLKTHLFEKHLS